MKDCPTDNTLADFIEGRLAGAALDSFYKHASNCQACAETLAELASSPPKTVSSAESRSLNPDSRTTGWGTSLEVAGRYRPKEVLGAGGMGVVYIAFDTQLNRNVALKLTRTQMSRVGVLRMFREAQAMAQLSHRNVVTVYDVGVWDERVFVAMEYLEGGTLAGYLIDGSHDWTEILEKFIQAGEGLAAAHRAGIVHRDFKAENVLLSATGEARVGDFGLARQIGCGTESVQPSSVSSTAILETHTVLPERFTRAGTVLGTPSYMAPEQIKGFSVDHRADQWSFCAALYEALYCELPFPGRTPKELLTYVERGSIRTAPIGSNVPLWLRHTLLRGLYARPEDRFASMEELLEALYQRRGTRRGARTAWLVATVSTLIVSSAGFAAFHVNNPRNTSLEQSTPTVLPRTYAATPGVAPKDTVSTLVGRVDEICMLSNATVQRPQASEGPRNDSVIQRSSAASLSPQKGDIRPLNTTPQTPIVTPPNGKVSTKLSRHEPRTPQTMASAALPLLDSNAPIIQD